MRIGPPWRRPDEAQTGPGLGKDYRRTASSYVEALKTGVPPRRVIA
jgi:hypothetical protein